MTSCCVCHEAAWRGPSQPVSGVWPGWDSQPCKDERLPRGNRRERRWYNGTPWHQPARAAYSVRARRALCTRLVPSDFFPRAVMSSWIGHYTRAGVYWEHGQRNSDIISPINQISNLWLWVTPHRASYKNSTPVQSMYIGFPWIWMNWFGKIGCILLLFVYRFNQRLPCYVCCLEYQVSIIWASTKICF